MLPPFHIYSYGVVGKRSTGYGVGMNMMLGYLVAVAALVVPFVLVWGARALGIGDLFAAVLGALFVLLLVGVIWTAARDKYSRPAGPENHWGGFWK